MYIKFHVLLAISLQIFVKFTSYFWVKLILKLFFSVGIPVASLFYNAEKHIYIVVKYTLRLPAECFKITQLNQ